MDNVLFDPCNFFFKKVALNLKILFIKCNLKNGICFQDVFLMIRRKKLTIFTDAKDTTTVLELKKMIEGKCEQFDMRKIYL